MVNGTGNVTTFSPAAGPIDPAKLAYVLEILRDLGKIVLAEREQKSNDAKTE